MDNTFIFHFNALELSNVLNGLTNPKDYVLIYCQLKSAMEGTKKIGKLNIQAEGFIKANTDQQGHSNGQKSDGCPIPPCVTRFDSQISIDEDCFAKSDVDPIFKALL